MGRGNPICFGIDSFAQRDLEVGVHGVADVSIGGPFIGFGVSFDGGLKSLDFVLKGDDSEAVDFFVILDGLDQTGGNVAEGTGVDMGVGGEYCFHGMRGIA